MDWSIGNIIGIGMRIISNRNEVARVAQKVIAQINQAEELWGEVRGLIGKIAPELLIDLHVVEAVPIALEPHAYDVKWVQQSLNHLLHPEIEPPLKIDGKMGDKTADAIKLYQHRKGLTPDGWIGPLTLAALDADIREAHARASR